MSDEKLAGKKVDILSLGPELPGGEVPFVRTRSDEDGNMRVEGGVGTLTDANSIPPEEQGYLRLNRLNHLHDNHYEVVESVGKGPAKVNSPAFKQNWDTIFGAKQTVGQA